MTLKSYDSDDRAVAEEENVIDRISSEEDDIFEGTPVYKIRSYPSDPELETLYSRWNREQIVIPDFQRAFVWKPAQASRLIESFLMGLPVPSVFVYALDEPGHKQLVIDGQQRLLSVFGFFKGKLPNSERVFKLTGVDDRWEGKLFDDLNQSEKNTLLTSVLRVVNIVQEDSKHYNSSLIQIFERLNTGGTTLTPQEIRNSSYYGPFNDMLKEINNESVWRQIFGTSQPDSRMRDIELIVRFLALNEMSEQYAKPMKQFISDYMAKHQKETHLVKYKDEFVNTAQQVVHHLGTKPFHIRRGINVAVFDSVMVAFAQSSTVPSDVQERYEELKNNDQFIASTTSNTTDVNTVQERLKLAEKVLFS